MTYVCVHSATSKSSSVLPLLRVLYLLSSAAAGATIRLFHSGCLIEFPNRIDWVCVTSLLLYETCNAFPHIVRQLYSTDNRIAVMLSLLLIRAYGYGSSFLSSAVRTSTHRIPSPKLQLSSDALDVQRWYATFSGQIDEILTPRSYILLYVHRR